MKRPHRYRLTRKRPYRPTCTFAVVDWDERAPGCNMYGCAPCPRCGSVYRAPYMRRGRRFANGDPRARMTVECDGCDLVQRGVEAARLDP